MPKASIPAPDYVTTLVSELSRAEDRVVEAREEFRSQASDRNRELLARAYATRGALRTNLGADREGLRDLLRSHVLHYEYGDDDLSDFETLLVQFQNWEKLRYDPKPEQVRVAKPKPKPDWCPDAQLGEALRVYARDTLLSMRPDDQDTARRLADVLVSAIRSFERAQLNCETLNDERLEAGAVRKARAWIASHRAACYTHFYFLRRSALKDAHDWVSEKLFHEADQGFTVALEENADYDWALKFKAFLLVLRAGRREPGRMSDFRRARNLLRMIETSRAEASQSADGMQRANVPEQTSLARSKAMLLSYDVGDNWLRMQKNDDESEAARRDGIEAAEKSVAASIQAVREDPEDFVAAYFGVASTWFLSKAGEKTDASYKAALGSALNSAKIRAQNAFSQALAVLTGLEDLEQHIKNEQEKATNPNALAAPTPDSIFQRLLDDPQFGLDWETRAILIRDPLNQLLTFGDPDGKKAGEGNSEFMRQRNARRARYAMPAKFADEALFRLGIITPA